MPVAEEVAKAYLECVDVRATQAGPTGVRVRPLQALASGFEADLDSAGFWLIADADSSGFREPPRRLWAAPSRVQASHFRRGGDGNGIIEAVENRDSGRPRWQRRRCAVVLCALRRACRSGALGLSPHVRTQTPFWFLHPVTIPMPLPSVGCRSTGRSFSNVCSRTGTSMWPSPALPDRSLAHNALLELNRAKEVQC